MTVDASACSLDTRRQADIHTITSYAGGVATFRRILKWLFAITTVAALVVAAAAVSGLAAPLPSATLTAKTVGQVTKATKFSLPQAGASAIGFADTETLLASKDKSEQRAIGGLAQIVTALVVLDAKPITDSTSSPTLTMSATDVAFHNTYEKKGGTVSEVLRGLKLTEYQVLQLMLLPSANNYAATAANWAYGSVDDFLNAASTWLADNGLRSTVITDPAGLDSGTVSTPSDLVTIARLAMANPIVAEIVSQQRVSLPTIGTVTNTNTLLGSNGIVGLKTSTTLAAGHCFLFAVNTGKSSPGSPVVGVILGQQTRDGLNAAVKKVASQIAKAYHATTVTTAGDTAATLTTQWGSSAELIYTETNTLTTVGKTTITVDVAHPEVTTLISGSTDGTATVTVTDAHGTQKVSVALQAKQGIEKAPISWQLDHALRWLPAGTLPFIGWR